MLSDTSPGGNNTQPSRRIFGHFNIRRAGEGRKQTDPVSRF